jgi:hypothetical protein
MGAMTATGATGCELEQLKAAMLADERQYAQEG